MLIAVIEDDDNDALTLIGYIDTYFGNDKSRYEVKRFASAGSFFDKYVSYFDLVFLDIEMPNMNGMEVSRKIRETNKDVVIIFVTNLAQYAVEGYSVNAFDFIVKPVEYGNFKVRFKRAADYIAARSAKIVIRETSNIAQTMPVSQIYYVEVFGHNLVYHTVNGDFSERRTLGEVEKKLQGYGFFKCSNYCLVNIRFVERIDETSVTVAGNTLGISRRRKKEFLEALTRLYSEGV